MSSDPFCEKFEAASAQLRAELMLALQNHQTRAEYRFAWKPIEDIIITVLIKRLTALPFAIPREQIIIASSKNMYPNVLIKHDGQVYAIDIKSGMTDRTPSYDIGRLDKYKRNHLDRFTAEYSVVVRWAKQEESTAVDVYIEPTYQTVGRAKVHGGVSFRLYDGTMRPKSWSDFEAGYAHWKTINDFKRGLRAALTYKHNLTIKKLSEGSADDLHMTIAEGENERLELKSTSCLNQRRDGKDPRSTEKIVIAVAGFMNTEDGGMLIIGVDDKTNIVGLRNDYKVADPGKPNRDGFQLFLRESLNNLLGASFFPFYDIDFHEIEGEDVCRIEVRPSNKPVFYKGNLFVRNGNQTRKLSTQEAFEYLKYRWSGY